MLFGTTAEGAPNANILDLRWNRPRFGLCGHFGRTVKTSITGNDFVANEVRRAYLRILITFGWHALPAAPAPAPVGGWRIPSNRPFRTTALLRRSFLAAKSNASFVPPPAT